MSSTVEPEMATAVMALALPSVVTLNAEAGAVVEERVSLYVRTTFLPLVLVAAETKVVAELS